MPKLEDETLDNDQDETLDDDVETSQEEDETENNESEQEEEDDSQDEGEDEDSEEDSDEPDFEKAFKNIKGDTPQEYAKNLEEAYRKSSQEGKLNYQKAKDNQATLDRIAAVVAKNPEIAKVINEATDDKEIPLTTDPALLHARQEMESKMDSDYKKFTEAHPELDTDPDLQDKVLEEVRVFAEASRKKGRIMGMDEALNKAWVSLGLDKEDSKEKIVTKAKETASKPKTNNGNKKSTGKAPVLSTEQIEAGRRMGLTEKQMLEALKKN